METLKLFDNSAEAIFIERPNRYTVIAKTTEDLKTIRAYCPNPGRLIEILVPGRRLILEYNRKGVSKRKTEYTVVAAYYKDTIVPLYSARANVIAEKLIIPKLFPDYDTIKREVSIGNSRIDFLVTEKAGKNRRYIYIEIKACTLIEYNIAMFPDAPTSRGKKHIIELSKITQPSCIDSHLDSSFDLLSDMASENIRAHVIFVIMNPHARAFIPNMHTDIDFTMAMEDARNRVSFTAVSIESNRNGSVRIFNTNIPIDWKSAKNNTIKKGVYMLSVHINKDQTTTVGSLGKVLFKKGYYVYVGSALNNLDKRIARHKKKLKTIKWHIDYLTTIADNIKAYPIRTSKSLECPLAGEILKISENYIDNFGSSDCNCPSHLFFFSENPEMKTKFLNILFRFRHREAFVQ